MALGSRTALALRLPLVGALTAVALFTAVAVELPTHARDGRLWALIQAENQVMFDIPSPELWFSQRVDHFAAPGSPQAKETFQQRFYEVNTHYRGPDGPVILYIGGEGAMNKPPTGFIDVLAKEWGAKILALEHRFYGKSIPHNDLSTSNYRYLTVQQALADLKHFKEQFSRTLLRGEQAKWIAIGGSYPGALAAWFRVAYPNTTVASLSSSGVVLPVYEFDAFDEQVGLSAGEACANVLRATTAAFEQEIRQGNGTNVKNLLGAAALADPDFFYMLADSAAMAVQYGHKDQVCGRMLRAWEQKELLTEAFARFTIDMYGKDFGSGCFYDTTCLANDPSRWEDVRSWRWQKCSQLAYFQVAPKEKSLRSSLVDITYHEQQCHTIFGDFVNPKKGVEEIIQLYGGSHPQGHKIFFSNGGDDPWQRASVLETLSEDEPANLAKCDLCGHCGDLGANSDVPEPLKQQRQQIKEYLTMWLHEGDDAAAGSVNSKTQSDAAVASDASDENTYKSSPLVLVPVLFAFVIFLVILVQFDIITDSPRGRRTGYTRLTTSA